MTKFEKWKESITIDDLMDMTVYAGDVARVVGSNPDDLKIMESKYNNCIQEAKLMDARSTNTSTSAWGDNYYVNAMKGATNSSIREPRWGWRGLR